MTLEDDLRFRQYLNNNFNQSDMIKSVINQDKSAQTIDELTLLIDEANTQIRGYIAGNTEMLMLGMQDFALLADRYASLSNTSEKLSNHVEKLKAEAFENQKLLKYRTAELERIHMTSTLLRLLRQFVHAKSQLDYNIQSMRVGENKKPATNSTVFTIYDSRLFTSVAKILHEVETLVDHPLLLDIDYVKTHRTHIKECTNQLRRTTQDYIIQALGDKNQANIASCLQIFYNLQSLPELIIFIIDSIVNKTVQLTSQLLDLSTIFDTTNSNGTNKKTKKNTTSTTPLDKSTTKLSTTTGVSASRGNTESSSNEYYQEYKIVLKEISDNWSTMMMEHLTQIEILTTVFQKKEDPTTHQRFPDMFKTLQLKKKVISSSGDSISSNTIDMNKSLYEGRFMDCFWDRCNPLLLDIIRDLSKHHTTMGVQLYIHIRRSLLHHIQQTHGISQTNTKNHPSQSTTTGSISKSGEMLKLFSSSSLSLLQSVSAAASSSNTSIYQSSLTPSSTSTVSTSLYDDLYTTTTTSVLSSTYINHQSADYMHHSASTLSSHISKMYDGLKPLHDQYLITVLARTNEPIFQMFPELEGFTAAIPSKRDLLAFIKSIYTEITFILHDGDMEMLHPVSNQCLKSFELLLTKVENMINVGPPDVNKVLYDKNNNIIKSSSQEHNSQLILLLFHLQDACDKLHDKFIKSIKELKEIQIISSPSSTTTSSSGAQYLTPSIHDMRGKLTDILNEFIHEAKYKIDRLLYDQLLSPLLDSWTTHIKLKMISLLTESSSTTSKNVLSKFTMSQDTTDGSKSIKLVIKTIMDLLQVHFSSFPVHHVIQESVREIINRIQCMFVTIACFIRPMNMTTKALIQADIKAIDTFIATIQHKYELKGASANCPIDHEYKLFQEFLSANNTACAILSHELGSKPHYMSHIRPSVLITYIMASTSSLLPLPTEEGQKGITCFDQLLDITVSDSMERNTKLSSPFSRSYSLLYLQHKETKISTWNDCLNQKAYWSLCQECLDVFVQRLSVIESRNDKEDLRKWYETIVNLGGKFFN